MNTHFEKLNAIICVFSNMLPRFNFGGPPGIVSSV